MKNKTVKLVLAIVVLGMVTGGYFGVKSYVSSQEKEEEEQEEEKTNVFEAQTDNITSLKFMIEEKEVTFMKEDGLWVKEDEKDFPVDQDVLDSAASNISSVDADRVLDDVEDLSEYGLDSPENTITVTVESEDDGEESVVLRVGMLNDSTSQYYIGKDEDKSTVYVVSNTVISPFMNDLYDYAESQDFPTVDSSTISKVTVEQEKNSYVAEKNEDTGLWDIISDVSDGNKEKADSAKMSSLTSSVASMEYESFVDYNCTDEKEYGFDNPYAVVTIDYEEEEETETDEDDDTNEETEEETEPVMIQKKLVLTVGNEAESDSRYVSVDGSNQVYTMSNDLLSTVIDKDVSAMWDMTVNYLSINDLDSLDIDLNGQKNTIDVSRETVVIEDESTKEAESSEEMEDSAEETADSSGTTEDSAEETADSSEITEDSSDETADDEESEPETETVITYLLNGEKLDDIDFTTFYNKLINISGQKRLTEEYSPEDNPEMRIVFHSLDNASVNVDFYEYDVNYYAAVVDNEKVYLLNKMNFKELRSSYEEMLAEDDDSSDSDVNHTNAESEDE